MLICGEFGKKCRTGSCDARCMYAVSLSYSNNKRRITPCWFKGWLFCEAQTFFSPARFSVAFSSTKLRAHAVAKSINWSRCSCLRNPKLVLLQWAVIGFTQVRECADLIKGQYHLTIQTLTFEHALFYRYGDFVVKLPCAKFSWDDYKGNAMK